jgi:hypothetical protein
MIQLSAVSFQLSAQEKLRADSFYDTCLRPGKTGKLCAWKQPVRIVRPAVLAFLHASQATGDRKEK